MKNEVLDARDKRMKKILLIVVVVCVVVMLLEGAIYLYAKNKQEQNTVYYDAYQMTVADEERIIAVGSSDFRRSKHNPYTKGIEKGKLVSYNRDGEVLMEIQYDRGISSTFTSVLVVEDGYIVTGSGEYSDYQKENNLRDAFLIKYDKDGNKIWEKFYGVLSNTRFNKVIQVSDGYVVIGQSIYEGMEVGNHTTGGGVIVKYDFEGNEIWHNNHGGNKSGNFNGIIEVNGDFYVVGKDASDTGNLIKFDKNGKYVWHKNYSYTDSLGFQDIVYFDKKLYVVGSKKILEDEEAEERKTDNTDGVIVCYDLKGKVVKEVLFGGSLDERFNAIQMFDNHLYIIGVGNSKDSDLNIQLEDTDEEITSGFLLAYDKDLNLVQSKVLGGVKNDVLTDMTLQGNSFYISGYSNSKNANISLAENNGKDYFGKIILVSEDFQLEIIQ